MPIEMIHQIKRIQGLKNSAHIMALNSAYQLDPTASDRRKSKPISKRHDIFLGKIVGKIDDLLKISQSDEGRGIGVKNLTRHTPPEIPQTGCKEYSLFAVSTQDMRKCERNRRRKITGIGFAKLEKFPFDRTNGLPLGRSVPNQFVVKRNRFLGGRGANHGVPSGPGGSDPPGVR